MTKHDWIELGVIGAGGLAVLWLLNSSSGTPAQNGVQAGNIPPYLGYNQPDQATAARTSLPTVGTPGSNGSPSPTCNCSGPTQFNFSTPTAYENSLYTNAASFLSQYEDNVLSSFPDFVTQFFNNQSAVSEQNITGNELNSFL